MNRILEEQQRRNRASRDAWLLYGPHRELVSQLLRSLASTSDARLCVLGAGNCNDLDLAALAPFFRETQLVDWDAEALSAGVAQQELTDIARCGIKIAGDIDLTGIAQELTRWSPTSPPPAATIDRLVQECEAAKPLEGMDKFDVVISICTLTQLIDSVAFCLGENHPRFFELVSAVRARHLRMLVELTAPGGTAVLCTDVVSSATCPLLAQIPLNQLAGALSQLIQQKNFFTGTNPFVLEAFFRNDSQIAASLAEVNLRQPWLWNFGPRVFAVCAITARLHDQASLLARS